MGHILPGLGGHPLEYINCNGKHVLVYHHLVTFPNDHMLDSILLVGKNILYGTGNNYPPYASLDMTEHGIL